MDIDKIKKILSDNYNIGENQIYFTHQENNNYYFNTLDEKEIYNVQISEEGISIKKTNNNNNPMRIQRLLAKTIDYTVFYMLFAVLFMYMFFVIMFWDGSEILITLEFTILFLGLIKLVFQWINFNNRTIGDRIVGIYKVTTYNKQLYYREFKNRVYTWTIIFPLILPVCVVMLILKKDIWNTGVKYISSQEYKEVIKEDSELMRQNDIDRYTTARQYLGFTIMFTIITIFFSRDIMAGILLGLILVVVIGFWIICKKQILKRI